MGYYLVLEECWLSLYYPVLLKHHFAVLTKTQSSIWPKLRIFFKSLIFHGYIKHVLLFSFECIRMCLTLAMSGLLEVNSKLNQITYSSLQYQAMTCRYKWAIGAMPQKEFSISSHLPRELAAFWNMGQC